MLTVGEALVNLLEQYSVDTVFGIPGTHSLELYRGLEKSAIRHILPRHEQGGGFMADGYARVTGKPGVCFVITGPGVTNITTPMGEAYMDSVPMLVISPVNRPDPGNYNQGRLHEITDQSAVTQPLTAFSAMVNQPDDIPELIARAFLVFNSERPRPVHISIPLDILVRKVDGPWKPKGLPLTPHVNPQQLEQAAQMINEADNALIIAGGGTVNAGDEIIKLAETTAFPVTTTVAGRGVIPASHDLSLGAQFRAEPIRTLAKSADLLIIIGSELAQTDHYDDEIPAALPEKQIRININSGALLNSDQSLAINADAGETLRALLPLLDQAVPQKQQQSMELIERIRQQLPECMTLKEKKHVDVLAAMTSCLPDDCIIVSDMTQLAYTAIDYLALETPKSWLHPTGYGTLGYALPAGMGVAIARPGTPVLIMVGDAGLQYTIQEMTLAAQLNLNIIVLLWNNDALLQISDDMHNAGIEPLGVTQRNPDFMLLSQASGWQSVIADSLDDLTVHLGGAFADRSSPLLIQLNENSLD